MTKKEKDGILSTILNIPTPLKEVEIKPTNILTKVLLFLRIRKPTFKMLYICGLKLSTNWRLTAITNALTTVSDKDGEQAQLMDLMHMNTFQMAGYIATAIHNQPSETPRHLITAIADNFTNEELHLATKEVYRRLDVQSFFGSMELVQNLSLI